MSSQAAAPARIASLDQFRGYTVVGMFLVNFVGGFIAIPAIFKHHNTYCSYADTIMPHFFFAVGFAYRLTLLRRLATVGAAASYARVFRRSLGLALVALVVYHIGGKYDKWESLLKLDLWTFLRQWKGSPFETLLHIAVTQIWVLPVIAARPSVRIVFAAASGLLHLYLSYLFNYQWVNEFAPYEHAGRGIDGGPLGFMTWTIPLLAGSLAYDAVMPDPRSARFGKIFFSGIAVMLLGYAVSCLSLVEALVIPRLTAPAKEKDKDHYSPSAIWMGGELALPGPVPGAAAPQDEPSALDDLWRRAKRHLVEPPFVAPSRRANIWNMSQRSGSLAYLTFSAGLSLALYALFVMACDLESPRARRFANAALSALAAFLLYDLVSQLVVRRFAPADLPLWSPVVWLAVFLLLCLPGLWRSAFFRTFGVNALIGYILHSMVADLVKPYAPKDSPLWYALAAFLLFLAINYLILRHLEKTKVFIRL